MIVMPAFMPECFDITVTEVCTTCGGTGRVKRHECWQPMVIDGGKSKEMQLRGSDEE